MLLCIEAVNVLISGTVGPKVAWVKNLDAAAESEAAVEARCDVGTLYRE